MKQSLTRIPAALALFCGVMAGLAPPAVAADHVPVLVYGRFGGEGARAIRLDQFDAQLAEIVNGGWRVLSLSGAIEALRKRQPLPERALVLTIDDAHESVFHEAWPRLKRAGLPFTVFVSTASLDREAQGYMTWPQLRQMAEAGVEIGNLTVSHPHMHQQSTERNAEEIADAARRIEAETGHRPQVFAYPYGEWTPTVRRQVIESGYVAAVGQQSGVAYPGADWFALPRFPINENFGSLSRFLLAATAMPLVVTDAEPQGTVVADKKPRVAFTVAPSDESLERLACFASSQTGPLGIRIGADRRVEIDINGDLPAGRTRINCTMPTADGRWRWYGMQLNYARGGLGNVP